MVDGFEVVGAVGGHASARAVMGSPIPGWNIAGVKSRCPGGQCWLWYWQQNSRQAIRACSMEPRRSGN